MGKIELTKGKVTIVDDEDFEYLNQFNWHYQIRGSAATNIYKPKHRLVLMHRLVMDAPEGMDVDHKNFDKLDNRKENLRVCTSSQNQANKKIFILKNT